MFAIIESGGKQFKVQTGDTILVERMKLGANTKSIKLEKVLLTAKDGKAEIGRPYLAGAYCEAEVLGETKAPKVISFKYIRREKSATKIGHRQQYLKLKIGKIHHAA